MLLENAKTQALLKAFLLSQAGNALKSIFWGVVASKLGGNKNPAQAGEAGAVPAPDTAPLTGAPHADPDFTPAHGGMAEQAMEAMEEGHGSNGTSYER